MNLRPTILLSLVGVLFACEPPESSDLSQYKLRVGLVDQLGLDSERVLVGTTFEISVTENGLDDLPCVASSSTGVVGKIGEAQFSVDAAGPGTIELAAPDDSCPELAGLGLGPDRWSILGVEASDATALWIAAGDSMALSYRGSPGPAGTFPEPFGRPLDRARVAAEGHFVLLPALVDQGAGERAEVRWSDSDGLLAVADEHAWLTMGDNQLDGRLLAGESLASSITIANHQFELPAVEVVPLDTIAELQLVAVYLPSEEPEREWGLPIGVVAIALDDDGHRILGAPIEWSVSGTDVLTTSAPHAELFGDDLVEFSDCAGRPAQPQWRSATVHASVAGAVGSTELEWLALPSDAQLEEACRSAVDVDPPDRGKGVGCGCAAMGAPRDVALPWFPLLALLAAVRRRRSRAA